MAGSKKIARPIFTKLTLKTTIHKTLALLKSNEYDKDWIIDIKNQDDGKT